MKPAKPIFFAWTACLCIVILNACNMNAPIFEAPPDQHTFEKEKTNIEISATAPTNSSSIPLENDGPHKTSTKTAIPTVTKQPTPTDDPEKKEVWEACPDSYDSRLHVGNRAYVSFDPPLSNRVRSAPSRSAKVVGMIEPGEKLKIISGPECADDWVWWKVKSEESNLSGWTSEGDYEDYWLVPLP